jgi:hypothetical protein
MQEGPSQFHFGIVSLSGGMIHAHAGLRRVAHGALPQAAPIKRWRFCDAG